MYLTERDTWSPTLDFRPATLELRPKGVDSRELSQLKKRARAAHAQAVRAINAAQAACVKLADLDPNHSLLGFLQDRLGDAERGLQDQGSPDGIAGLWNQAIELAIEGDREGAVTGLRDVLSRADAVTLSAAFVINVASKSLRWA